MENTSLFPAVEYTCSDDELDSSSLALIGSENGVDCSTGSGTNDCDNECDNRKASASAATPPTPPPTKMKSGQAVLALNPDALDGGRAEKHPFEESERLLKRQRQMVDDPLQTDPAMRLALGLEMQEHEDTMARELYSDANIQFLELVAGFCGMNNVAKLMKSVKDTTGTRLFRDELLGERGTDVQWGKGEKRISSNGQFLLTPMAVAARDSAYHEIMTLSKRPDLLIPPRWFTPSFTMDCMVKRKGLNTLFAQLTACNYRQIALKNPTRYVTYLQKNELFYSKNNIKAELISYFRDEAKGSNVDVANL